MEEADTTYGKLGVKVWICRGEVLPGQMVKEPEAAKAPRGRRFRNDRMIEEETLEEQMLQKRLQQALKEVINYVNA